jgi:myosin heavy subunit
MWKDGIIRLTQHITYNNKFMKKESIPRKQLKYCYRLNGDEPVSTLTQDFHTRLDNLLRTLVHARPHFVRCLRSNASETPGRFDRATVMRQIRSLQVLETVNLMAGGMLIYLCGSILLHKVPTKVQ